MRQKGSREPKKSARRRRARPAAAEPPKEPKEAEGDGKSGLIVELDIFSLVKPPHRSLDDFILGLDRYGMPKFDRLIGNLLYYQENYFTLIAIVMCCIILMYPGQVILGNMVHFVVSIAVDDQIVPKKEFIRHFLYVLIIEFTLYYSYDSLFTLLVTLIFLYLGKTLILVHASVRLRNIENKNDDDIMLRKLMFSRMGKEIKELLDDEE